MYNSKGTDDFNNFIRCLVENINSISATLGKERDYLISISVRGDVLYRT